MHFYSSGMISAGISFEKLNVLSFSFAFNLWPTTSFEVRAVEVEKNGSLFQFKVAAKNIGPDLFKLQMSGRRIENFFAEDFFFVKKIGKLDEKRKTSFPRISINPKFNKTDFFLDETFQFQSVLEAAWWHERVF